MLASEQYYKEFGRWPGSEAGVVTTADVTEVERFAEKAISAVHIGGELPNALSNAVAEV